MANIHTCVLSGLLMCGLLIGPVAWSGAPDKPDKPPPGKPTKLATPTPVTCSMAGEQVTVTWGVVDGAAFYRVMLAVEDDDLVDQAVEPTYSIPRSVLTLDPSAVIEVKVRAMRTRHGKGASKPSDAVTCQ